MSCFAGRRRYLEVLLVYVNELLDKGLVDEFHIWDYTRDPDDANWIQENCQRHQIFQVKEKNNCWREYYEYYEKLEVVDPMSILIKCDDDIVFIDVDAFEGFIKNRLDSPQHLLAFPSIINNWLIFQVQVSLGLWNNIDTEKINNHVEGIEAVHNAFLNDYANFLTKSGTYFPRKLVLDNKCDIYANINFFAILAKDLHLFKHVTSPSDEMDLSIHIPKLINRHNYVDPSFVVTHMACGFQRDAGFNEGPVLEKYKELAKKSDTTDGP
jgi:hypothetical protein